MSSKEGKVHVVINRAPRAEDDPAARNFWTKNRTECLLNLLADQAQTLGDIDHDSVAIKMTNVLNLKFVLKKENIVERLDSMFQIFQKELFKENQSQVRSSWIWMKQLQFLVDIIQEKEDRKDEKPVEKLKTEENGTASSPTVKRPIAPREAVQPTQPTDDIVILPSSEKIPNNVSVIRQIRPPAKPHPATVPLKVTGEKDEGETSVNQRKVDIKIGIKPPATFNTDPSASANNAQPMMIAVKTANNGSPILIPISNSMKVQSTDIPKDISPINNATVLKVQKLDEAIPTAVISSSTDESTKRATTPSSPRLSAPDEGNQHLERRNRMPDPHVDFLLHKYRNYLQERMLESGRLSKGTFNEIANDLNREFSVAYYEREQVASKLQNLKTQFRQKRSCVENGNDSELYWKWYQKLDEIMQIESSARDQNEPFRNSSISPDNNDAADDSSNDKPIGHDDTRTNGTNKRHRTPPRTTNPRPVRNSPDCDKPKTVETVIIETSSDDEEDDQPISTIIKRKNQQINGATIKRVKIDTQVMDEALFNLISQDSETSPSGDNLRSRLKDKKDELLKLRVLAFNLFQSVNDMLKTIDD